MTAVQSKITRNTKMIKDAGIRSKDIKTSTTTMFTNLKKNVKQ